MTVFTLSHYAYTEFSIIYFLITYKVLKTRIKKTKLTEMLTTSEQSNDCDSISAERKTADRLPFTEDHQ